MDQRLTGMSAYTALVSTEKETVMMIHNVQGVWFADMIRPQAVRSLFQMLAGTVPLQIAAFTDKYAYNGYGTHIN